MFLHHVVDLLKIQVSSTEEQPPECAIFGILFCVCCSCRLYGHGWRKRYCIDVELNELRIWIHRKYCPVCGMTYTLIPEWLHVFKCYSVDIIRKVLEAASKSGHLGNQIPVSRSLQRSWIKQFRERACAKSNVNDGKSLLQMLTRFPGSCIASPLRVQILTRALRGKMDAYSFKRSGAHQRLLLFVPSGLL